MLCLALIYEKFPSIIDEIEKNKDKTSLVELRFDNLSIVNIDDIKKIQKKYPQIDFIFTWRKNENEIGLNETLFKLIQLKPKYFDLAIDAKRQIAQTIINSESTKLILSYHDFEKCDFELLKELADIAKANPGILYKFAAKASVIETMRMLIFLKEQKIANLIIAPMSEKASFGRIMAKIYANFITYTYASKKTAEGQIQIDDLINIYRFDQIDGDTQVFALLGDPVDLSIGHLFHNTRFSEMKKNAIYLKISVTKGQVGRFLEMARRLSFFGFSVTAPLKELVVEYLDEDYSEIQVVNTIKIENGKLLGFNTDGKGAMLAIAKYPIKEPILVIGAGATAKSIVFELRKKYKQIYVANRTRKKAKLLAQTFDILLAKAKKNNFETIFNATSSQKMPSGEVFVFQKGQTVFDVANQKNTLFLKKAENEGANVVSGREMFFCQALFQLDIWFKNSS